MDAICTPCPGEPVPNNTAHFLPDCVASSSSSSSSSSVSAGVIAGGVIGFLIVVACVVCCVFKFTSGGKDEKLDSASDHASAVVGEVKQGDDDSSAVQSESLKVSEV